MAPATFPQNGTTDPVENIIGRLNGVRRSGSGYAARCPSHDDRQASLSVGYGDDGRVLLNCFAGCETENVVSDLGLTMADLFPADQRPNVTFDSRSARPVSVAGLAKRQSDQPLRRETNVTSGINYRIRDLAGTVVAIHMRFEYDDGSKQFFWQRPNGESGLGGRGVESLPLYGSERLAELPDGATVIVCEGEKATEALWHVGLNAVGTVTGASSAPSVDVLHCLARFRKVVLWPDNDDVGRNHMRKVAERLLALEARS